MSSAWKKLVSREVGRVEDHAEPLELLEELDAVRRERAVAAGADGVPALAVVGQVHRAQTQVPPGRGLARRRRSGRPLPWPGCSRSARGVAGRRTSSAVRVELGRGADHPQQPAALEQLVIGELAAGRRRGDLLVGEVEVQPGMARPAGGPRGWARASSVAWQTAIAPRRISGSVVVARPRAGWSVMPARSRSARPGRA